MPAPLCAARNTLRGGEHFPVVEGDPPRDRDVHSSRATAMFTLGGSLPFHSAAAAKAWHTLADPEKAADGLDEFGHRDRLRQISFATTFADALFIALHRECRHRDHGNGLEFVIFLEP